MPRMTSAKGRNFPFESIFFDLGQSVGHHGLDPPAVPVARTHGSRAGLGTSHGLSPSSCLRRRNLDSRNVSLQDVGWRIVPLPEEAARTSCRLGPQHRPSASTWRQEDGRASPDGALGHGGRAPSGRGRHCGTSAGRAPGAWRGSLGAGLFGSGGLTCAREPACAFGAGRMLWRRGERLRSRRLGGAGMKARLWPGLRGVLLCECK